MRRLIFISIILLILGGLVFAAEFIYVQSIKADIMAEPSLNADVKGKAVKGDRLIVIEETAGWYKINFRDKTGWVSRLLVAPAPPMKKVSVITGEEQDIGKESRRRASMLITASAARGLTEEDRRRLGHKELVDYSSLERLEAISIRQQDVFDFMEKGK